MMDWLQGLAFVGAIFGLTALVFVWVFLASAIGRYLHNTQGYDELPITLFIVLLPFVPVFYFVGASL